jgi:hypothetical protein
MGNIESVRADIRRNEKWVSKTRFNGRLKKYLPESFQKMSVDSLTLIHTRYKNKICVCCGVRRLSAGTLCDACYHAGFR